MSKKQVAIITGASKGIGRSIARKLANSEIHLVLISRNKAPLETLTKEINIKGGSALAIAADVTSSGEVDNFVKQTIKKYGSIDILVNNVGRGLRKNFHEITDEEWLELVNINLTSVMNCCRSVIPHMTQQNFGKIINIASRSGRVGESEMAAYCAVKHGVIGLTKALSEEYRNFDIHINAISPGPVSTERMKKNLPHVNMDKWLTPDDIATAVDFLLSSPGNKITGQSIDLF